MDHRPVPARVLQGVAFALALAATLAVLFFPLYTSETISAGSRDPDSRTVTEQLTLLAVNGPAIFVPLLVPVLLTGLPLLIQGKAWRGLSLAATLLLAVFAVLGLASIGWFYLPALFAAAGALLLRPAKTPPAAF